MESRTRPVNLIGIESVSNSDLSLILMDGFPTPSKGYIYIGMNNNNLVDLSAVL